MKTVSTEERNKKIETCTYCDIPLTLFDKCFSQKLLEKTNENAFDRSPRDRCFKCFIRHDKENFLEYARKRRILYNDLKNSLKFVLIAVLMMLYFMQLRYSNINEQIASKIGIDSEVITVLVVGVMVFFWIYYSFSATKNMQLDTYSMSKETQMVSTVSKDGTITTRFVEGYVYEDSSSVFWTRLMLSVVYPYWFILRPIIALIINRNEMRKKYPNEVIRAFNIAERKYPHVQISKKDARTNNRKMERYDKKIEKIEKKYSVLGKKIVEERKSEVSKPIKKLHIKGKEYIIHRHFMTKKYQDGYFLIGKKLSGKIFGLVLIDGCYVDNDIDNWTNTWNEISRRLSVDNVDYEKEADKIIDLYKHCL